MFLTSGKELENFWKINKIVNSKIMKKSLVALISFVVLSLSLMSSSHSQATAGAISGKVGVFGFAAPSPAGWRVSPEAEKKANELLESDSVQLKAAFATMFGSRGPIIYATWTEFPSGFAVPAAQIASSVSESTIPNDWKLVPGELKVKTGMLPSRIEYSYWRLIGMGNGKQFGGGGSIKTLGIWIDIPVAYKDGGKVGGGIASFYLRGAEAEFKGTSKHSAEQLLITIAESLVPTGAEIIPLEALTANAGDKNNRSQQTSRSSADSRSEAFSEMPLEQATDIIKQVLTSQNSSPSQMLSACEAVKQHMSSSQHPGFRSANPELRRLDSICENRLEKTILFARIKADFGDTAKLKSYLTPIYDSAASAGSGALCDFLYYVDSIWEENDFKRPDKDQCPRRSRLK